MPTPSIAPKTRRQIAAEYQISPDTLRRRLRQLKVDVPSGSVLPAYQRLLYERLGYPADVDPADYSQIPLPEDTRRRIGLPRLFVSGHCVVRAINRS